MIMRVINILLVSAILFGCSKSDDSTQVQNTSNNIVGTWKWENPTDYYWYEYTFNSDYTGWRTDADSELDSFTYQLDATQINFVSGFPSGRYDYTLVDPQRLKLFNDTLIKQ